MTVRVRDAGGLQAIASMRMREADGLKVIASGKIRGPSGLDIFFGAGGGGGGSLSAQVDQSSVSGAQTSVSSVPVSTFTVTAIAMGGVAPYTYSWEQQTGADPWTIVFPTNQTVRFRADSVPPSVTQTATFACTITDANGSSATTPAVTANASNLSFAP